MDVAPPRQRPGQTPRQQFDGLPAPPIYILSCMKEHAKHVAVVLGYRLGRVSIRLQDDLNPWQRRIKEKRKPLAARLYNEGIKVKWDFEKLFRKENGRWIIVPDEDTPAVAKQLVEAAAGAAAESVAAAGEAAVAGGTAACG